MNYKGDDCDIFDPECYSSREDHLLNLVRRVWTDAPGLILYSMLGKQLPNIENWPKSVKGKPIQNWTHDDVEQFGIAGKTIATLYHLRDHYEERERELKWLAGFVKKTEEEIEDDEEEERYGDKKRWMQLESGWTDRLKDVMLNHQKHTELEWGVKEQQAAEMAQAAYLHNDRAKLDHFVDNVSSLGESGWKVDYELSNELGTVFTHPEKGAHLAFRGSESPLKNPRDWLKNVVNATGLEGSVEKVRKMANKMTDAIGLTNELKGIKAYQELKDGAGRIDRQHRLQNDLVQNTIEKYDTFSLSGHSRGAASSGQVYRDYPAHVTEVHAFNGAPFRGVESLGKKYKPYSIHGDLVSLGNQQIVHQQGGNTHIAPRFGKDPLAYHDLSQFTGLNNDGPMPNLETIRPEKAGRLYKGARSVGLSAVKGIGSGLVAELGSNLIGLDAERLGRFSHDALVGSVAESILRWNRTFLSAAPGGAVGAITLDKVNELTSNLHPAVRAVASTSASVVAQRLATLGTSLALESTGALIGGEIGAGIASLAAETSLFGPAGWIGALVEIGIGSVLMLGAELFANHQREEAEKAEKAARTQIQDFLSENGIKLESSDPKMDKLIDLFASGDRDDLANKIMEIVYPEEIAEARRQKEHAVEKARERKRIFLKAAHEMNMRGWQFERYVKIVRNQERIAAAKARGDAEFNREDTIKIDDGDSVRTVIVADS